jgi:two-component system OmpR family response regulator
MFGDWKLDTRRRTLHAADSRLIALTSAEYDLLLAFVERPQRVLSREQLLDLARGRAFGGTERSVDAQVSRLRAKLGAGSTQEHEAIKTVRSMGYMLVYQVEWT